MGDARSVCTIADRTLHLDPKLRLLAKWRLRFPDDTLPSTGNSENLFGECTFDFNGVCL